MFLGRQTLWKFESSTHSPKKHHHRYLTALHKKRSFPLRISLVNVISLVNFFWKLRIWSHLLKRSLTENFIFCLVQGAKSKLNVTRCPNDVPLIKTSIYTFNLSHFSTVTKKFHILYYRTLGIARAGAIPKSTGAHAASANEMIFAKAFAS